MATATTIDTELPDRFAELPARLTKRAKGVDENEPDVVATITCETVDADREVVIASGADLTRFRKNPVIMLCHQTGGRPEDRYVLPVGTALWIRQEGSALLAGIRFSRKSTMGREVLGLFEESILRAFSIGFRSLSAGPPTREEKRLHPEWANADLIHRKWNLHETSVVGVPCNEDAVVQYVRKGGKLPPYISIPAHFKTIGAKPMDDNDNVDPADPADEPITEPAAQEVDTPPAEPVVKRPSLHGDRDDMDYENSRAYRTMCYGLMSRHSKIMHSGKAGHLYANPDDMTAHMVRHKDDDGGMVEMGYHSPEQCKAMLGSAPNCKGVTIGEDHPETGMGYERIHPAPEGYQIRSADGELTIVKAMGEGSGPAGGYVTAPSTANAETTPHVESDANAEPEPEYTPKAGHFVKWDAHHGMPGGCGKCMSVHKSGRVPDAMNDADADDENPHARVKMYRAKPDDPHSFKKTETHVAVACKMCKRMPMVDGLDEEKTAPAPVVKAPAPTTTPVPVIPEPPKFIPKFRTRAEVMKSIERGVVAKIDHDAIHQRACDDAAKQLLGSV